MTSAEVVEWTTERWLLIDGNNVMGSRPDGWWRDRPAAKLRLTTQVTGWARTTGRPTILVFDGRPDALVEAEMAAGPRGGAPVEVRFAGAGRAHAADDLIVIEAGPGDTVVTADRGLIQRLATGVEVVGPTTLLAALDGSGRWGAPEPDRAGRSAAADDRRTTRRAEEVSEQ